MLDIYNLMSTGHYMYNSMHNSTTTLTHTHTHTQPPGCSTFKRLSEIIEWCCEGEERWRWGVKLWERGVLLQSTTTINNISAVFNVAVVWYEGLGKGIELVRNFGQVLNELVGGNVRCDYQQGNSNAVAQAQTNTDTQIYAYTHNNILMHTRTDTHQLHAGHFKSVSLSQILSFSLSFLSMYIGCVYGVLNRHKTYKQYLWLKGMFVRFIIYVRPPPHSPCK